MSEQLRVAMDVRMAQHSGIGTYIRSLRSAFEDMPDVVAAYALNAANVPIYSLREQWAIPRHFSQCRGRPQLLHVPHYNAPLRLRAPLVVTVHDLIHHKLPHFARRRGAKAYAQFMLPRICDKAAAIICVSEHTRRDLLALVPDAAERAHVVPHGCNLSAPSASDRATILQHYQLEPGYVLYVGNIRPHKNVDLLVQAWRELDPKVRPLLVLVGSNQMGPDWPASLPTGVRLLPTVPFEHLAALYSGAKVFAYPSLYEGFGFPPLEAMRCGTAVICSNAASLPEVVGTAARLLSPENPALWTRSLNQLLCDMPLREDLARRGQAHSHQFTWERAAAQTVTAYRAGLEAS